MRIIKYLVPNIIQTHFAVRIHRQSSKFIQKSNQTFSAIRNAEAAHFKLVSTQNAIIIAISQTCLLCRWWWWFGKALTGSIHRQTHQQAHPLAQLKGLPCISLYLLSICTRTGSQSLAVSACLHYTTSFTRESIGPKGS